MKQMKVVVILVLGLVAVTQVEGNGNKGILGNLLGKLFSFISDEAASLATFVLSNCLTPFETIGCAEDGAETTVSTMAFLFTRRNPRNPEFLHLCRWNLAKNTNFDPSHKTEIFIHGWLDGICRTEWMVEMKEELFKRGSYNVILIDWTWGNGLAYNTGAENVYVVQTHVAALIQNIMRTSGVRAENFHIIGHSFGAQIAGLVGQIIPNLTRITALDPALAPFQNKPASEKLDRSDATLVDVIHSNGGSIVGKTIGDIQPLGDADFYPNGGRMQESCKPYITHSLLKLDLLYAAFAILPIFCSHLQSIQYYKASINPTECKFIGFQCSDYESFQSGRCRSCGTNQSRCAVMGMDYRYRKQSLPRKGSYRKYYLDTTNHYPYCTKQDLVMVK